MQAKPIIKSASFYIDKEKKQNFFTITKIPNNQWSFVDKKNFEFGFTDQIYWVRLAVTNTKTSVLNWYLEVAYPPIDDIQIGYINKKDEPVVKKTGDNLPFSSRDINYRNCVFDLNEPASGTRIYYLRFSTSSSMNLFLNAWSTKELHSHISDEYFILGIYYGLILVMILYNFFLFISLRDNSYLLYILWIISYNLYQLTINGLSFQYLWPNAIWWQNHSLPFFITIGSSFALMFGRSFLQTKKSMPGFDRIIHIMIYLMLFSSIPLLLLPYAFSIKMSLLFVFLIVVLLLSSGISSQRKGNRAARFYLAGWTVLLLGVFAFSLKSIGLLPDIFITRWGQQIGSALEVVLLSLALADRIQLLKREKDFAQQRALTAHSRMLTKISDLNRSLEAKVHERTRLLGEKRRELEAERNELRIRNEIIEKEITMAKEIQENLIPHVNPRMNIAAYYKPMEDVGGDFYDFIQFSNEDKLGIFISDVSGHGLPAAFITSMIKTVLLQSGETINNPAEMLLYLNQVLHLRTNQNFITVFYCIFNEHDLSLSYSSAGHLAPVLLRGNDIDWIEQRNKGIPLAVMSNKELIESDKQYTNTTMILDRGDKLFLYTDGLTEAVKNEKLKNNNKNIRLENFGDINFQKCLKQLISSPAREFVEGMANELIQFCGTDNFEDDVCMICLDV